LRGAVIFFFRTNVFLGGGEWIWGWTNKL